jgi:two-component system, OmpR family, sensor histidine kinase CiaH
MLISLFFSLIVYRVSSESLETGLQRQSRSIQQMQRFRPLPELPEINRLLSEQLAEGKRSIILHLLNTNLVVLLLGGTGSYFLARRTLRPIEEALDAQTRFAADASHELRTPLTTLQTEIEVALRDKKLKLAEAKGLLASNLEEVARLKGLAEGLLTLSRHQNGGKVEYEKLQADELVEGAKNGLRSMVDEMKATIAVEGKATTSIEGNRESLISLLTILLENALKYSPAGSTVTVSLKASGRYLTIEITDKGVGIAKSDLPYIFERFYRAEDSRSRSVNGYGLGLSIARQIVEMHNGSIEAASEVGKGTGITVRLPRKQPRAIFPV